MQDTIGVSRVLIYRCSLIFCFAFSISCGKGGCSDKKTEQLQTPSALPASSKKISASQRNKQKRGAQSQEADQQEADPLNRPDPLKPQKIKQVKRVAKVKAHDQAIVLLHGLSRLSYDFDTMKPILQRKFPHATIVALTSVDKDSSKKGTLYNPPSMKFSIKEQAKLAYEEIKTKIGRGKHLVVVGHSQGGLRGFALIKEYAALLKGECGICIDQLITIATPWKGAPALDNISKHTEKCVEKFKKVENVSNAICKDYNNYLMKYFFKIFPGVARKHPTLYKKCLYGMKLLITKTRPGSLDLAPGSDFICNYVASGLKEVELPITAIAGVLVDFSKLFEPFPSSISPKELTELNRTYATLIGGDRECEHDMLLPVATQHAEGLVKKNFTCIKVEGACHGNKVGITVKKGLSELNNKQVIEKVVACIDAVFYEEKEELVIEEGLLMPEAQLLAPAA